MPTAWDDKPVMRQKLRLLGGVLGLAVFALLLTGYVRVRPVLNNYALVAAIKSDDLVAARAAIRHGANVNAYVTQEEIGDLADALAGRRLDDFPEPQPVLGVAVDSGHVEMVDLLVSQGADVNAKFSENWTPLMLAVDLGNVDIVHSLIAHGADVNAVTGDDGTPVLSFTHKHPGLRPMLVAAGAHDKEWMLFHRGR